jgi:hypothetical protein
VLTVRLRFSLLGRRCWLYKTKRVHAGSGIVFNVALFEKRCPSPEAATVHFGARSEPEHTVTILWIEYAHLFSSVLTIGRHDLPHQRL